MQTCDGAEHEIALDFGVDVVEAGRLERRTGAEYDLERVEFVRVLGHGAVLLDHREPLGARAEHCYSK